MILDHRTYTFRPGTVGRWLKKYESEGLAIQKKHLGTFLGLYTTEVGNLHQIVFMWGYDSMADREKRREALDMMRKRIRRGIKDGDVPKTADVDGIAAFYTAVLQGIAFSARDGVAVSVLGRVVDSAVNAWDSLVSAKQPKRRKDRRRA